MTKATLPFGEWRPDLALLDSQFASIADNVFPASNSYKALPSLLPFSSVPLPTQPARGLSAARRLDGTWRVYAGSASKLYVWSWSGWDDVTRTVGGNYNVPENGLWSWAQFGTNLIAVSGVNDAPQLIDVEAGATFENLSGSPPFATNVHTIGDFLVLAGLEANPRKVRWSGINDVTQWTIGMDLCDEQEFPDGGLVMGTAGNEIGYIMQDRSIRVMQFLPNDTTFIFQFSRVLKDKGTISPYGWGSVSDIVYFLAEDGFYALAGSQLVPIGQDKVNEWFLNHSDVKRRNIAHFVQANKPYIAWAFHETSASPTFDRLIIYNWANQRWATATINAQIYALLGTADLDLDTDGTEPGDPLLDSAAQPLDSFAYRGGRPLICAINELGELCSLGGPNLQATVETGEAHLVPGARTFVSEAYPLVDIASSSTVTAATRERLQDAVVWGTQIPIEITGSCALYSSSRLHRFRLTIPAGETWTDAQGLLIEAQQDGTVA